MSLRPAAERLSELVAQPVTMAPDCVGDEVERIVENMKDGDIVVLENLRFYDAEEANDPEFAKELARLGDLYINDAFGTAHRAHASTEGVTHCFAECAAGFLMQKELRYLGGAVDRPRRPFLAIIGGVKISGKIDAISALMHKVDAMIIGGGMAYTFFKAQGLEVGDSVLEADKVDLAKETLQQAEKAGIRFLLPVDCVIADAFSETAQTRIIDRGNIPPGWQGLDIGPKTVALFTEEVQKAETILWNGPLGVFEMDRFAAGTNAVAQALAEATSQGAITIIGGGDSAAAVAKAGLEAKMTHISTGGGASLEYLEGKTLPGVAALTDRR
jgi:phosphoglycerate kinase